MQLPFISKRWLEMSNHPTNYQVNEPGHFRQRQNQKLLCKIMINDNINTPGFFEFSCNTFESDASATLDQKAVDFIMGHETAGCRDQTVRIRIVVVSISEPLSIVIRLEDMSRITCKTRRPKTYQHKNSLPRL